MTREAARWALSARRAAARVTTIAPNEGAQLFTVHPNGHDHLTDYQGGDVKALVGSYSPNGKDIVFRLEDHGLYALMTMRADGSHLRTILPFSTFRPRGIDRGPRVH